MVDASDRGGIALYSDYLVSELRQLDLEVHLCAGGDRSECSPGLPSSWTASGPSTTRLQGYLNQAVDLPIQAVALLRAVRAVNPDVVHLQTSVVRRADPAVNNIIRRRFPLVATVHNAVPHENAAVESRLERRRWNSVDALIVHNDEARAVVEQTTPSKPVFVTPVDLLGAPGVTTREEARRRLGLEPNIPIALALGLVRPYKGFGLLSEAWPDVRAALPHARLFVVGAVQRAFADLDRLVELEGVEARLEWLVDVDVDLWAAAADVCVLPYDHGAHSGVLHRAVVNGTPVLASPTLADELARFGAGRIVDLHSAAWTSALIEALGPKGLPPPRNNANRNLGLATRDVYRSVVQGRAASAHLNHG
jgi:glycosyltransferase involved in cell wall biosynthesis